MGAAGGLGAGLLALLIPARRAVQARQATAAHATVATETA